MAGVTWQFVRQIPWPYPGLSSDASASLFAAADGVQNSFALWPALIQAEARASLANGVKLRCVPADYASATLFGVAAASPGSIDLRLIWPAPA